MSPQTATSLEQQTRRLFELFDALDTDAILELTTEDAQGIDEISRGWLRGRAALESYFGQIKESLDGVSSEVRDLQATEWGDAGLVTCVVDQSYRMEGQQQQITAPTTIVYRREGDDWKIALVHSAPLPDAPEG